MKLLFDELPPFWRWPVGVGLAGLLVAIFFADLYLLPESISLIIPYLLVVILGTFWIGRGVGLIYSISTLVLWFLADTNLLASFPEHFSLNFAIKAFFILLEYAILYSFRQLHAQVRNLALTDPLTGLNNRRAFLLLGRNLLLVNHRRGEESFLLFLDIDHFKQVNDSRGHAEGDLVLQALAGILLDVLRESDLCARIGGDEFCLLLTGEQATADAVSSRLEDLFRQRSAEQNWPTTLSIGIVVHNGVDTLEQLLEKGDELMYQAKKKGR